jgi:hypothetical protein
VGTIVALVLSSRAADAIRRSRGTRSGTQIVTAARIIAGGVIVLWAIGLVAFVALGGDDDNNGNKVAVPTQPPNNVVHDLLPTTTTRPPTTTLPPTTTTAPPPTVITVPPPPARPRQPSPPPRRPRRPRPDHHTPDHHTPTTTTSPQEGVTKRVEADRPEQPQLQPTSESSSNTRLGARWSAWAINGAGAPGRPTYLYAPPSTTTTTLSTSTDDLDDHEHHHDDARIDHDDRARRRGRRSAQGRADPSGHSARTSAAASSMSRGPTCRHVPIAGPQPATSTWCRFGTRRLPSTHRSSDQQDVRCAAGAEVQCLNPAFS